MRWTVTLFDVVRVLAGGVVVKFWGLFFAEAYGATPLSVFSIGLGASF